MDAVVSLTALDFPQQASAPFAFVQASACGLFLVLFHLSALHCGVGHAFEVGEVILKGYLMCPVV